MKHVESYVRHAVIVLIVAGGLFYLMDQAPYGSQSPAAPPPPKVQMEKAPISPKIRNETSFAGVVKKVIPSVVSVYSSKVVEQKMPPGVMEDPFFRKFLGLPGDRPNHPQQHRERSLGSGVIVSPNGYILTDDHVVEGATDIKVGLAGQEMRLEAKIVGTDSNTDIAVIKVEAKDLPVVTLTDSDQLQVGDVVLAIGNPFGLGETVTSGIVSAKGRGGMGIFNVEDFIQTDAPINPGNSGGALVDAEGRLVGINTAILSGSGGNQGIGFAIPINLAHYVMSEIIAHGKFVPGYLGASVQAITLELAREFRLPIQKGALIGEIAPHSPAASAGLKAGDAIVQFNDHPIMDGRHLRLLVAQTKPGSNVMFQFFRQDHRRKVSIQLAENPAARAAQAAVTPVSGHSAPHTADGVQFEDLNARLRRHLKIPENVQGAMVTSVEPGSSATGAKLHIGDVIVEVDHQPVSSAKQVNQFSRRGKNKHVLLRYLGRWKNPLRGPRQRQPGAFAMKGPPAELARV